MIWFALAICFLLVAILAAIKRGPQAAAHEIDVRQLTREQHVRVTLVAVTLVTLALLWGLGHVSL